MAGDSELLKGNTPTLILAVLQDGSRHGYGIAREIEARSSGLLSCKEGTLYPALHLLESDGLVTGEWRKEPGGRDRKVYSLTPAGRAALESRIQRWRKFALGMDRIIGGSDNGQSDAESPRGRAAANPVRARVHSNSR